MTCRPWRAGGSTERPANTRSVPAPRDHARALAELEGFALLTLALEPHHASAARDVYRMVAESRERTAATRAQAAPR